MTRWLLAAALVCGGALSAVSSAPAMAQTGSQNATAPTEAQIDKLFDTLEMERTLSELFSQMNTMSETLGTQMMGEDATAEQRATLQRVMAQQQNAMRDVMSWKAMAPIYRRVYMRLFTADEVDAMIAFYGNDTGRGIMRKMPQAMQMTMEEMGPVIERLMHEMRKTLETEVEKIKDAEPAHAN